MLIIQTLSIQKEHIADLLLRAAGLQSIERQLTYAMNEYQPPTWHGPHVSSSRTANVAIFSVLHTTHHRHCQISKCRDPLRRFTKTVDLRFATCQSLADCVDCEHQKLPPPCITMLFVCLFVCLVPNKYG